MLCARHRDEVSAGAFVEGEGRGVGGVLPVAAPACGAAVRIAGGMAMGGLERVLQTSGPGHSPQHRFALGRWSAATRPSGCPWAPSQAPQGAEP